jgi:hypothetical protein
MATVTESASTTILGNGTAQETMGARTVPIITTTTPTPTPIKMSAPSPRGDPMDLTTPTSSSAPGSSSKSPEGEGHDQNISSAPNDQHSASNAMPAPVVAAQAVHHQTKIVQTAFIHKLYKCVTIPPRCAVRADTPANRIVACWRIKAYGTSSAGRIPTKVLSSLLPRNSQRSLRKSITSLKYCACDVPF